MVRISCAVALALAALPASAQDSEVSKLREEVRRLQERVQDLDQQQKAKPQGQSAFNPAISLILQGTPRAPRRIPTTFQITGFVPSGGEVGAAAAQLRPGARPSSPSPPTSIRTSAAADRGAHARERGRSRGGLLPDAGAAAGLHAQGRALPFRHRLPERDPPARVGLPGRAARLQGVPRRPLQPGRRAAEVGRADRSVRRARRRGRPRPQLSRHRPQQERRGRRQRVRAPRRRHRREHRLARRPVLPARPRPTTAASTTSTRSATRSRSFTGNAGCGSPTASLKWAPDGNARTNVKLQGEYFRRKERHAHLRRHGAGCAAVRRGVHRRYAARSRAGTRRASTSSCRAGASATATTASTTAR